MIGTNYILLINMFASESRSLITTLLVTATTAIKSKAPWFYGADGWPLVVGHRGSLGHFPEHTIAGYTDAWLMGADYVELDL
jgi:glycerophosphoryl diester phosphodiesterase